MYNANCISPAFFFCKKKWTPCLQKNAFEYVVLLKPTSLRSDPILEEFAISYYNKNIQTSRILQIDDLNIVMWWMKFKAQWISSFFHRRTVRNTCSYIHTTCTSSPYMYMCMCTVKSSPTVFKGKFAQVFYLFRPSLVQKLNRAQHVRAMLDLDYLYFLRKRGLFEIRMNLLEPCFHTFSCLFFQTSEFMPDMTKWFSYGCTSGARPNNQAIWKGSHLKPLTFRLP